MKGRRWKEEAHIRILVKELDPVNLCGCITESSDLLRNRRHRRLGEGTSYESKRQVKRRNHYRREEKRAREEGENGEGGEVGKAGCRLRLRGLPFYPFTHKGQQISARMTVLKPAGLSTTPKARRHPLRRQLRTNSDAPSDAPGSTRSQHPAAIRQKPPEWTASLPERTGGDEGRFVSRQKRCGVNQSRRTSDSDGCAYGCVVGRCAPRPAILSAPSFAQPPFSCRDVPSFAE